MTIDVFHVEVVGEEGTIQVLKGEILQQGVSYTGTLEQFHRQFIYHYFHTTVVLGG